MTTIALYINQSRWVYTAVALATFALPWAMLDDELNPTAGVGLLPQLISQVGHNPDRAVMIALGLCVMMYVATALFVNARLQNKSGGLAALAVVVTAGLLPFLSGPVVQNPHVGWGVTLAVFAVACASSVMTRLRK